MTRKVSVAILGSTGFVGIELVKILSNHPNVNIVFFGTENNPGILLKDIHPKIDFSNNPSTKLNTKFDSSLADTVFLALPHVSHVSLRFSIVFLLLFILFLLFLLFPSISSCFLWLSFCFLLCFYCCFYCVPYVSTGFPLFSLCFLLFFLLVS